MSTDLAVVVFAWGGSRPIYLPWHAENMRRMVAKHLTVPHRFVVVTDDVPAHQAAGLDAIPIWDAPKHEQTREGWVNCYVRLGLFDEQIGGQIAERILSIDLDAVIRTNIDDFVTGYDPVRLMACRSRGWLQGGLFRVDPGRVHPNPWEVMALDEETNIFKRSEKWVGSDQAVLSELFYDEVQRGQVAHWTEQNGLSINEFDRNWRVFFRTGYRKCWHDGVPEQAIYLAESGRAEIPKDLPLISTTRRVPTDGLHEIKQIPGFFRDP